MFNDDSNLPGAYDRHKDHPEFTRVIFRDGTFLQGAELNESQSILETRIRGIAELTVNDGDRISGSAIVFDALTGNVTLTSGEVYVRGAVRQIAEAQFVGLPLTGEVVIGVRLTSSYVTEVQLPILKGLAPGTWSEGQKGAARRVETVSWGWKGEGVLGDGQTGDLYSVYQVKDGTVLDQRGPTILSDTVQQIGRYDRDAHGNYIVNGCLVTALGRIGADQHFAIEAGVANIFGFKRERSSALRHIEPEAFDTATVTLESHFMGASPATVFLNYAPLSEIVNLVIEKEVTDTITKGVTNAADTLGQSSVITIVEVKQGATTYVAGTSYTRVGDTISWAPGGAEPAQGSTYTVKYRYRAPVVADSTTNTTVTVSGGVNGGEMLITYRWKLPRTDLLCLDTDGASVYVKGLPSATNPRPPIAPQDLLPLCEVKNLWSGSATVVNNGIRAYSFAQIDRIYNRLLDTLDLATQARLNIDIDRRYTASKNGTFADPLESDELRDQGATQTMAVAGGRGRLAINASLFPLTVAAPVLLNYTEEVLIRQEAVTSCMKINPYSNFTPLPAKLQLNPASDFWVDHQTQFTSDVTRTFTFSGSEDSRTVSTTEQVLDTKKQNIRFMRSIAMQFTISGFGAGEVLTTLTLDGVSVKPPGIQTASGSGVVTGAFTVPANAITAGTKRVIAVGAAGSKAEANFTGQGIVEIETVQRTVTVNNFSRTGKDPLAQTFTLNQGRFITGIDVRFCAKGNVARPVEVEIREVDNGEPTQKIVAQTRVDMAGVVVNTWTSITFAMPVWLPADREFCFVLKTSDNAHALSIATIGKFDATAQRWVSKQPYTIGVLLASSNDSTWTPLQGSDLAMRIRAAKFAPISKTVNLGTFTVANASDLMVRAATLIPTAAARIDFEIERANGEIHTVRSGQNWQLTQYISENVIVRAKLSGNSKVSPVLFPHALLVAGELQASGTYVSRIMEFGAAVRVSALMMHRLPAGSSLTVDYDLGDNTWLALTAQAPKTLNDGWSEQEFRKLAITGTQGRIRITLAGTPAARPEISDVRAWSAP